MRRVVHFILVVIIIGAAGALVYGIVGRAETVTQPILFNHALHIDSAGLECIDCHTDAMTRPHAGLPGKDSCFECHDVDDVAELAEAGEANPELVKLIGFADSAGDIPWRRVALSASDVFFSHRRHVASAELACEACHAEQSTQSAPPTIAQPVMTMEACMACHEDRAVSNDCLSCHR